MQMREKFFLCKNNALLIDKWAHSSTPCPFVRLSHWPLAAPPLLHTSQSRSFQHPSVKILDSIPLHCQRSLPLPSPTVMPYCNASTASNSSRYPSNKTSSLRPLVSRLWTLGQVNAELLSLCAAQLPDCSSNSCRLYDRVTSSYPPT